ncbi:HD domain-containing phosphohydrolase [Clostridium magnum]|uniref:Cyclic di-GMP phosphodiesterase response regulator RpfG n=1 Tax=Clostridium magnum DSM 2767 TaxID=1121326 RepID=A0A161WSM1_9CLOT|nr:HD domain-containing phosphohydrolase [Clostridium magnum]KZL89798.1 cyclic di-GMP phosphodiesterase response regulator RpfG [Clostridium magnum DSM 2767]SHI68424.1 PAS domain S-box-containing protein/diguanylate cyclase (GGDEF) domain-containing protein [Clostridium magnum DSM 2767]
MKVKLELDGVFNLQIRKKVSTITLFLLMIAIIGICSIAKIHVLGNIKSQEKSVITNNMNKSKYLIDNSLDNLNIICGDWAPWDNTLEFINTNNSKYIKSNLNDDTFVSLKINTLIILDINNKIRYANFYDLENKNSIEMPQELLNYINSSEETVFKNKNVFSSVSGIISVNGRAMMLSARPITDSEFRSPASGTVLIGKYIDSKLIKEIENISDSKMKIEKADAARVLDGKIIVNNGELEFLNEDSVVLKPIGKDKMAAHSIVKGIDNKLSFILTLESERTIYNKGVKSIGFLILLLIFSSIVIVILCNILLEIIVIRPIEEISGEVSKIDLNDSNISRITVKGNDELSILGIEINNMLDNIEAYNKKVVDSERQLKLVLEGAGAGFWDWNFEEDSIDVNEKFLSILGYSREDLPYNNELWQKLIHKEDFEHYSNIFYNNMWNTLEISIIEQRMLSKCGEYKWILNQFKVVEHNKDGKPKRVAGIVTDIGDKKRYEEELQYLTYYDKLTGIFNRGYYEYILDRLDKEENLPIAVIMGDLNGLKITNDTFGHGEGDKLLKGAAEVLKKVCGSSAIVSRYGGDEFIVVLEHMGVAEVEKICKEIKRECEKKKVGPIYLNIALGYSIKANRNQNINEVIKEAEEMMYRNKLLEDRSARNSITSSLRQTLLEKNNETKEHVERMYNLCVKISDILNLSTSDTNELYLLAKLHDIGKIGIDDKILNKPGKLTEEEWNIMKTHSEIGYRIASSTPDLMHIAYKILTHHERYDGTGYPKGLKGEEIPLLSRILAIVDAFDVMTNERPYKKAMTVEEAIEELKKFSGTQFDPDLVEIFIQAIKNH